MKNFRTISFCVVCLFGFTNELLSQSLNNIDFNLINENCSNIQTEESFGFSDSEIPSRFSLEQYALVSSQNGGSCVGFAVAGAMNIMHNYMNDFTSYDFKYVHRFDPYYLYCTIKDSEDLSCINCDCGSHIFDALDIVKNYGVKKSSIDPLLDCGNQISKSNLRSLSNITSLYSIDKYLSLFEYKKVNGEWYVTYDLEDFKWAIANYYPIITGINVDNAFGELGATNPKYYASPNSSSGHAVTIIGYDDYKYGGAFKILNSYGIEWGEEGYFWMSYEDFFNNSQRAFIMSNDSWDSWTIEQSFYSESFYRDLSADNSSFWEGPINSQGYFDGKGIEHTKEHIAIGAYKNGFRNGWWLILQKAHLEDPWRGLVLFDNGEIVESESFGFSSASSMKDEFIQGLHNENYNINYVSNPATEDDLFVPTVDTKVNK